MMSAYAIPGLKREYIKERNEVKDKEMAEKIIQVTCIVFRIKPYMLRIKSRAAKLVHARYVAVSLMRRRTGLFIREILEYFIPAFNEYTGVIHCTAAVQKNDKTGKICREKMAEAEKLL